MSRIQAIIYDRDFPRFRRPADSLGEEAMLKDILLTEGSCFLLSPKEHFVR